MYKSDRTLSCPSPVSRLTSLFPQSQGSQARGSMGGVQTKTKTVIFFISLFMTTSGQQRDRRQFLCLVPVSFRGEVVQDEVSYRRANRACAEARNQARNFRRRNMSTISPLSLTVGPLDPSLSRPPGEGRRCLKVRRSFTLIPLLFPRVPTFGRVSHLGTSGSPVTVGRCRVPGPVSTVPHRVTRPPVSRHSSPV